MRTVELFCGTKSFSKYAKKVGCETFTVDIDDRFRPDYCYNLTKGVDPRIFKQILQADIVWMSPPCTTFSMAAGNKHWTKERKPKTKEADEAIKLLQLCQKIALFCNVNGIIYFIENPRARARWFLPIETRETAWYCQYGDNRAKPTDIWTNLNIEFKACHNNNKECHHQPAPRGSKTGTQGLKDSIERSRIPIKLFEQIFLKILEGRE